MGKVIDLTDGDGNRDVLTQTEAGGLFGGTFLGDRPVASYLEPQEDPKYLLQNKKSGLRIAEEAGERTIEPDGDYRALALATDLRLLVVVGTADGDESLSLPLSEIVEADVESGLRSSKLTIERLSGGHWEFPCRGDPDVVAEYLENAAQAWANAGRLLDELEAALDDAAEYLDDGEYREAAELLADAEETIRTATARGEEIGPGAREQIANRAAGLRSRLQDAHRRIRASAAAALHARGQDHWQADEYEAAARAYDSAIESYEEALNVDGSTPADEKLRARLRGAAGERELLRVGPLVEAEAARRRADSLSDSEAAAAQWEQALDGYRELLGLTWDNDDQEFVVNRDRIRDQTVDIADDAIDDHLDAGTQRIRSGDELAVESRDDEAETRYETARNQFEHAHSLATEVRPDRVEEIETAIEAAETRLTGDVPRVTVPDDPLATEFDETPGEDTSSEADDTASASSVDADDTSLDEPDTSGEEDAPPAEFEELSFPNATTETTPPSATTPPQEGGEAGEGEDRDERDEHDTDEGATGPADAAENTADGEGTESDSGSLLDEIQARNREQSPSSAPPSEEPRTDGARPVEGENTSDRSPPAGQADTADRPSADGPGDEQPESPGDKKSENPDNEKQSGSADRPPGSPDDPDAPLSERLRDLDESTLTALVAAVWEDDGWTTRVFDGGGDATYDIVATREEGSDQRYCLVWTVQRQDGGEVGEALLRRCATTLENSPSADGGIVVTTGSFTRAAGAMAAGSDLEVLDCEDLVDAVTSADLPPEIAALIDE